MGSLVVGGLIERGDTHRLLTSGTAQADAGPTPDLTPGPVLDPDDLAGAAWRPATSTEREVVANTLGR